MLKSTPKLQPQSHQLINNLHLIRQLGLDEAKDDVYRDWKKLIVYLDSELRRLAPSLGDWSKPWLHVGEESVAVSIEPNASWAQASQPVLSCCFSIFPDSILDEDSAPNVALWIDPDWEHSESARSCLEDLRPEGFVNTYRNGDADGECVFWKNLPLDDYLRVGAFDLDGFVRDIAAAFEALAAIRPAIDEFLSQHIKPIPPVPTLGKALILDVETWGLGKPDQDEIVEVGLILTAYDSLSGALAGVLDRYDGLRDPGSRSTAKPSSKIPRAMVSGKKLDNPRIESMVKQADTIVAHNAQFDRPRFEKIFPSSKSRRWLCSCNDLDWSSTGCGGASLEYLCQRYGVVNSNPHRALPDAEALLKVLAKEYGAATYFAALLGIRPQPKPRTRSASAG